MTLFHEFFSRLNRIPPKLFKIYSAAPSYIQLLGVFQPINIDLHQACIIYWVCWKERPLPYEKLIFGYGRLNEIEKINARRYVNEKFTEQEAQTVKNVLENQYKVDVHLEEIRLPLHDEWHSDATNNLWQGNYPSLNLGKDVPFDVYGHVIPATPK